MTLAIVGTVSAYGLLALLLLSLNLTSRWRWWIKAGAIVVTAAVFVGSYFMIMSLIGWPSTDYLPRRFALLQTKIIEPDKIHDESGAIYLWVQEIDDQQRPVAPPRAYAMPFTPDGLKSASDGQDRLNRGEDVVGVASPNELRPAGETGQQAEKVNDAQYGAGGRTANGTQKQNPGSGSAGFEGGQTVTFEEMPPPELPNKPVFPEKMLTHY